jgi:hypothetical protein
MTDPALSTNFNINELESALKFVKPGTAAGFNSVNPSSASLPKLFKRAKVIASPKYGSDSAHY